MARGTIRKHERASGVRYEVVVDLGFDPATGQRRQRSKSFKTKREAQAALAAWLAEIDKGTALDRSRQTVAELLRDWLETYARPNVRPRTLQLYEETINRHLIPGLGHHRVQGLTPAAIQAFYARKLADGGSAWSVGACHQRLKQALGHAYRLGLVSRNVCDLVSPPRVSHRQMTTWTAEQARQFLSVVENSCYGPIWLVALATGMRRGELLGMRWQDTDLERGIIHVRQAVGLVHGRIVVSQPKSISGRRAIPIQPEVVAALRKYREVQDERRRALGHAWQDHDLVFAAANGKPINPDNLRRDYDRLVQLAGVPRIRIHDQRHTHVTLALSTGANLKAVSQRIGHAQTSLTLNTYAHVLPEQHTEVADRVGRILFNVDADEAPGAPDDRT
jgi:integrase